MKTNRKALFFSLNSFVLCSIVTLLLFYSTRSVGVVRETRQNLLYEHHAITRLESKFLSNFLFLYMSICFFFLWHKISRIESIIYTSKQACICMFVQASVGANWWTRWFRYSDSPLPTLLMILNNFDEINLSLVVLRNVWNRKCET